MTQEDTAGVHSPYDIYNRMFLRMKHLSGRPMIALINGTFGKNYPLDSTIQYSNTEFVDHKLNRILADSILIINGQDSYHMEAQMYRDYSIVLRMMEYGFHHALATMPPIPTGEEDAFVSELFYPNQLIIYLDEVNKNTPDSYPVDLHFPGSGRVRYHIPVLKFQEQSLSELLEKNMILLLPFRLLNLRKKIEKERSKENVKELMDLYRNDIIIPINKAYEQGLLTWRDRLQLLSMARRLEKHLYTRFEEIRKEIERMKDPYLDLDIDEYDEKYEALENKYKSLESQLADKDSLLADKDSLLADKDSLLADKDKRILELEAQLASMTK